MNLRSLLTRVHFIPLFLLLTFSVLVVWSVLHVPTAYSDENGQQEFYARLREGVGTEARLPATGASAAEIRASVDAAANFIAARSGVNLSEPVRARLASMEASTLAGTTHKITREDLSYILADTAIARVKMLTNEQIAYAAEVLRGFNAPDLPPNFKRKYVQLRASEVKEVTPEQFIEQVTTMRNSNRSATMLFRGAAESKVAEELKERINYLGAAIPEQYAAANSGITPLQALLLTYSVAADDALTDSLAQMQARMESDKVWASRLIGEPYPSPAGKRAYGVNGYIFSTPLDLAFDEQTLNRFLDGIAERSAQR